ncbi:hypothetical protein HanPI659440_Chr04g0154551 [Helianthus annuus]|nr:hypothetical protein HanPI659440_Chr04g0154551 [Helianthus annuus]
MVSLLLLTTIGTSLGLSISRGYWCNPVRIVVEALDIAYKHQSRVPVVELKQIGGNKDEFPGVDGG